MQIDSQVTHQNNAPSPANPCTMGLIANQTDFTLPVSLDSEPPWRKALGGTGGGGMGSSHPGTRLSWHQLAQQPSKRWVCLPPSACAFPTGKGALVITPNSGNSLASRIPTNHHHDLCFGRQQRRKWIHPESSVVPLCVHNQLGCLAFANHRKKFWPYVNNFLFAYANSVQ